MPAERKKTAVEQVEALVEAIPASGEIEYTALYNLMVAADNKDSLNHMRSLKQQNRIKMRNEYNEETNKTTVFVSRV